MHGRRMELGRYGEEIEGWEDVDEAAIPAIPERVLASVAVVVPVYGKPHLALRCIRMFHKNTHPAVRLIVIDDASDAYTHRALVEELGFMQRSREQVEADYANLGIDERMRFVAHRPRCALLTNKTNLKYTRTINRACRFAFQTAEPNPWKEEVAPPRVEWLITLNSDTAMAAGWLERMLACALGERLHLAGEEGELADRQADVVCPYMSNAANLTVDMPPGASYAETARRIAATSSRVRQPAVTPVGACMMFSRRAWQVLVDKHKGFDEERSPEGYGEECHAWVDWLRAGLNAAIADDAYGEHKSHGTFGHEDGSEREKRAVDIFINEHGPTYEAQRARAQRSCQVGVLADRIRKVRTRTAKDIHIAFFIPYVQLCGGVLTLGHLASRLNDLGGFQATIAYQLDPDQELAAIPTNFAPIHLRGSDPAKAWLGCGGFPEGFVVATAWFTGRPVRAICERHEGLNAGAFVQDVESRFIKPDGRPEYDSPDGYADYVENVKTSGRSVVNSAWVGAAMEKEQGARPAQMIPIGVETDLFYPRPWTRGKKPRVLAMHRPLTPRRGSGALQRLYRALWTQYKGEVDLAVYGQGWMDPGFPVECLGVLTQEELAEEMGRSWIVVDPSSSQGWGMTAQEGMASGCAVVTLRNGGIDNFGRSGSNCLIAADEAELYLMVARLVDDAVLRDRISLAGRQTAVAYRWAVVVDMWARALEGWKAALLAA